jgi:anti-sigma regulatory factor (Ser/Thr protein kinase)
MSAASSTEIPIVVWGSAGAALDGQAESGDLHVVVLFRDGALVALVDGLGHGPAAALPARAAAALLTAHAAESPLSLIGRCHEGLRTTRGAVMTVASLSATDSTLTWLGVGNVEGVLLRGDAKAPSSGIALRGGVVGDRLPPPRVEVCAIARGDMLILTTDGIHSGFKAGIDLREEPQAIAEFILARFRKASDDACVVVARYVAWPRVSVPIRHESDVAMARKQVRELAYPAGFREAAVEALATAVTELARNILVHAGTGEIRIACAEERGRFGLVVVATDRGPGIADLARAQQDHYSTGQGLGLGLPSARRFVDEFDLSSTVGGGTTVTLKKWLP